MEELGPSSFSMLVEIKLIHEHGGLRGTRKKISGSLVTITLMSISYMWSASSIYVPPSSQFVDII